MLLCDLGLDECSKANHKFLQFEFFQLLEVSPELLCEVLLHVLDEFVWLIPVQGVALGTEEFGVEFPNASHNFLVDYLVAHCVHDEWIKLEFERVIILRQLL